MINFLEINTLPDSESFGTKGNIKTGGSGSIDLFASMLEKIGKNAGGKNLFSALYSDNSNNSGFVPGKPVIKSATENLKNKKINPDEMIIPAALQNQLVAYLEKQGFALKDLNQVIASSKNQNGLIEIVKLFKGLASIKGEETGNINLASFKQGFSDYLNEQGIDIKNFKGFLSGIKNELVNNGQKEASFIETSSVPGTGEVLFKLGLGAEDVKKALEKSTNGKGELETGKLTGELNRFLTNPVTESDLISLLSENSISVTKRMFNKADEKTVLDNLSAYSKENRLNVIQNDLKQNINELLKEKGVSEDKIGSIMTKLDSAIVRFSIDQQANNISAKDNPKQDIFATLKEIGISEEKIDSVVQKLNSAITGLAINQQQAKDSITEARNNISIMGEDKKVISGMLGDNPGQDVSSFLKSRGVPGKDIKNIIDSLRANYKNTDLNQNDNLRSALLNDRVTGTSKNDPFTSSDSQGNLKLNFTELLKTTEKGSGTEFNKKSFEGGTHSETTFKATLEAKDKSSFTIKETADQTSINMLNANSIRNIAKTGQTDTGIYIPQPLPKIVEKMLIMFRAGEYQSRLQITPPELGRLDIDLTIKNGRVQANLSAESSAVKEIIEANLNQLKQQLNSQGLTIDKFNVMVSPDNGERKDNSTWAHEKENKGSGKGHGFKEDSIMEISAAAPLTKGVTGNNQIDVHV
ncbi:MAG: flagellar hook-length control protein FliK [Deltaproteobacteria bacterium]|nr:flagellar hook-length control protein FliK [Deltaproteobacteria bacterium]